MLIAPPGQAVAPEGPGLGPHACLSSSPEASWQKNLRTVRVDPGRIGGRGEAVWVTYDLPEVTRTLNGPDLRAESDLSLAVRLVLGEVGIGRLIQSEHALEEAVAILQTVDNRLNPATSNPRNKKGVKAWPGCGKNGSFHTCADPTQYIGLTNPQALDPVPAASRAQLEAAVDTAVEAWWITRHGRVGDLTNGATGFLHRCGGTAYGSPTTWCDGVGNDKEGARPSEGPAVFRAPGKFNADKGWYELDVTTVVDYEFAKIPRRTPAPEVLRQQCLTLQ